MLAKVLTNAAATFNDGLQPTDFYLKTGAMISAEDLFQTSSQSNRYELGQFLGVATKSGRFGSLRPIIIGHDVRWVCETHYAELRPIPPM